MTSRHVAVYYDAHNIAPRVEHFPMSRVNEALQRLREGKPHYRIVLDADFA